jgi:serine/threonine protein kinase
MPQAPTAVLGKSAKAEFPRAFGILALLKRLSSGARGDIYVALRPEGVDRLCVVNLLAPTLVNRPGILDVLRAQAGWLVARVHGNLVQTYDVGHVAERLFLLNEYVEGRDLASLLTEVSKRRGGLSIEAAAYVAVEVSAAVGFIRSTEERVTGIATSLAGLSASSVMVSREGTIKLVHHGSGLARSPEGFVDKDVGRASLIAPEHTTGGGSARGDVYAVGALLWQMLTGRPLAGGSTHSHLAALRAGTFEAPRAAAVAGPERGIPPALDDLLGAALSRRPEHRPPSCEALRAHLVSVVKGVAHTGNGALRGLITELFAPALAAEGAELAQLTEKADRELARGGARPRAATLTNFEPMSKRVSAAKNDGLPIGEVIPGSRYRVLEKLGEGGMGAVYAAEHVDIERRVALKLVHADLLRNPLVLGQFRQEARAASRIGNPYICDVTDWGELPDGRVFFVMEYLDGPSLGKVLEQKRKLPPARCIPILRQVAKALGAAHEKGIVHLDVKPDNVLLLHRDGRADVVKVVDFGVAGILGQASGASRVMGTPEYMAPERATGRSYDHRSDVYSLGVMAYEMLVGEVPFQGSSPIETLAMQTSEPPDRINERLTSAIPDGLEAVVMKMLEKAPDRRPQNMAEVEALLLEAQIDARLRTPWDDLPLPPVAPDRAARIARRLRSSARRLFLVFSGTVLVALSAVVSAYFARMPEAGQLLFPTPSPPSPPVASQLAPHSPPPPPAPAPVPIQPAPTPAPVQPPVAVNARTTPTISPLIEPTIAPAPSRPPRARREESRREEARREESRREEPSGDTGKDQEDRDPAAARAAVARGRAALADGRILPAKSEFEAALAADPRNVPALDGITAALFELANYEEVVFYANRAIHYGSRSADTYHLLGMASSRLARLSDALRAYQKARTLNPALPGIDTDIATVKAKMGAGGGGR